MTFGEKLKEIRKRFGLTQEKLSGLINVSRQAITKWENDEGLPDITNLQELSKLFGVTIDYLLDKDNNLPALTLRKELDKDKYKSKLSMYDEVLKEYFDESYEIYNLSRSKKMSVVENLIDTFIVPEIGPVSTADALSDLSPYYLVKKDNLKFLVNIKNYILEIIELPNNTSDKKIIYNRNIFRNCGRLNLRRN
ncbi:MAG: helix-turn-helix domain-containing protein [Bacilli bacterium]